MSQIEVDNQLLYILLNMERSKEIWMMCKVRKVTTKEEKNKKDPHHMALLLDREEQPQVIEFYPETLFGL